MSKLYAIICVLFICSCTKSSKLAHNYAKGNAFGTTYSIQFIDKTSVDYTASYDSLINVINNSMSTYQRDSDISRINKGDTLVRVDDHFKKVFETSKNIYNETQGAFDPTIGQLVNAWNFGPEGEMPSLDSLTIDSLLVSVGLNKIRLHHDKIIKKHNNTYIDFNALAKGYAVDVFADFLESKGYSDYLVEIGGEIRGKGSNTIKKKQWKIGVEDPNFDQSQSYSKVISLVDQSMATSGSYRKYRVSADGKRYAHIINAKTGYPHQSSLLSVSVITASCMQADAYATAFMSMGLEAAVAFLKTHPELEVYFIYENGDKQLRTLSANGFPED